jgi:PAS domain S-box-containing protein
VVDEVPVRHIGRAVLAVLNVGVLAFSERGECLECSIEATAMWGLADDCGGRNCLEVVSDAIRTRMADPAAFDAGATCDAAAPPYRAVLYCTDERVFEFHSVPLPNTVAAGASRVWVFLDITDSVATSRLLAERDELLEATFEGSGVGICRCALDGTFEEVNRRFCQIAGRSREELIGHNYREITHPDDLPVDVELEQQTLEGRLPGYSREKRYVRADGTIVWIALTETVLFDQMGVPRFLLGVIEDITARRLTEEQLAQAVQELSRSNQELERFAYVASHDMKEPLRYIATTTHLLALRYGEQLDAGGQALVEDLYLGVERVTKLIDDILSYSQVGQEELRIEPVDLGHVLDAARRQLRARIEESGARILAERMPVVWGDIGQLTQVFQNLLGNAIKFRGEAPPRIEITVRDHAKEWVVAVRDNGIGIAPWDTDRVFGMFQRLQPKERYSGSGIGLAICRKVIERHRGRIWVESEVGVGSTFVLALPKSAPAEREGQEPGAR